jgi:hypothetical protein
MMTKRGVLQLWIGLSIAWMAISGVITSHDWVWGFDHPDPSLHDWMAFLAIVMLPPIGGLSLTLLVAAAIAAMTRPQRSDCSQTRS